MAVPGVFHLTCCFKSQLNHNHRVIMKHSLSRQLAGLFLVPALALCLAGCQSTPVPPPAPAASAAPAAPPVAVAPSVPSPAPAVADVPAAGTALRIKAGAAAPFTDS